MANTMADGERKLFKDWFDQGAAQLLAAQVGGAWRHFDRERFVGLAVAGVEALEFHDRIKQFSRALRATLPEPVPQALEILQRSLPPASVDTSVINDGWLQWPVGQYIAEYGTPHFEESMELMLELTQRFTAEFAVRPFLLAYPELTFERLQTLTTHPNPHVRRWCSEGVRPRLPWGRRIPSLLADPGPLWPILEALKDDPDLYVRRSVANNLNDVAKDHPAQVVARCRSWMAGADSERRWVIERALRSMVKDGDPEALAVLGFAPPEKILARLVVSPARIGVGESVECRLSLKNGAKQKQKLAVDYAVGFARKGGKSGRKVFKWKTVTLAPGETVELRKKHPMRRTTVRALYPGVHPVQVQVNGLVLAEGAFLLV